MIFHHSDALTVVFEPAIEQFFTDMKATFDYRLESGGILVGTRKPGTLLTVTDISVPQNKDLRLPSRFRRSPAGHQKIMDALWEDSGYQKMYLGEWHTHREPRPAPSPVDTSGWKSLAKGKQNTPWMLFLILGQQELRLWTIDGQSVKELVKDA